MSQMASFLRPEKAASKGAAFTASSVHANQRPGAHRHGLQDQAYECACVRVWSGGFNLISAACSQRNKRKNNE